MNLVPTSLAAGVTHGVTIDTPRGFRSRRDECDAFDAGAIADLSDSTVVAMTREELVRLVCAADLPLPLGYGADRLRLQDQGTLQRLAFLARRACRNRATILECGCLGDEP